MIAKIKPSTISGIIHAPASKSSMQRACAAALMAQGTSVIHHPGHANDDKAAIEMIRRLGAKVSFDGDSLRVQSSGIHPIDDEVNCGESGLGIRMFTPIIALADKEITINGEGSLLTRPMDFFDEILPQLGITVQSNNGKLPVRVKGPLQPKNIAIDGSLSSQFLTGLLMAYAAANAMDVSIKVTNLTSKPYIDLTLDVMKQFGLKTPENKNYEEFIFSSMPQVSLPASHDYTVEGDWSGSAFLLVAGAISGPITVKGLDLLSTQADRAVMNALRDCQAGFAIEAKGIKMRPGEMRAFEFDATDCPDLFPPLVALASYCHGNTRIKGVNRLTYKESNRSVSLQAEFAKMGITIDVDGDLMIIHGGGQINNAKFHSHHDHRIAMACAVAALKADGESEIQDAEAVKKSYPDFYNDLEKLGANVSLSSSIKFHE